MSMGTMDKPKYRQKIRGGALSRGKGRTPMCTAAILTVAKRWKQPKGLLMNEWVSKM